MTGKIYTVSKLTGEIKTLLEETYPFLWVCGEISNYAVPASGHSYFTLKDNTATISAVMFKNQKRSLKFNPENGLKIIGLARISLYEPRGAYQLIFEHLEPEGRGSLQLAFEQLKKKLSAQGLFDDQFKKTIPFLSSRIGVITSPTSAALRDIINIAKRRFPNCRIKIFPVRVQGDGSEEEIKDAIAAANELECLDVLILARGGGSLEDLSAFNSEGVAQAVFQSKIPIITGVGHETDFTIADFVADLRAPTPSAAAELALQDKIHLVHRVLTLQESLDISVKRKIERFLQAIKQLKLRLKNPKMVIYDARFKLEEYDTRLKNRMKGYLQNKKERSQWLTRSLLAGSPMKKIHEQQRYVSVLTRSLTQNFQGLIHNNKVRRSELNSRLQSLNPRAVLKRGYSISRFADNKNIISDSRLVKKNDRVEIILSNGRMITKVEKTDG